MKAGWLWLCLGLAIPAHAEVSIGSTRLVYPAGNAEISMRVNNPGELPSLVQVWIDDGDPKQSPDDSDVPFIITPPVSSIAATSGQRFRIRYTGEPLAADRESVFWVNVLEVPPTLPTDGSGNRLHVLFRSRIKMFFRPPGLSGSSERAASQLRCRRDRSVDRKDELACSNPSPFHVSVVDAELKSGHALQRIETTQMLAPFGEVRLPLPATVAASKPAGELQLTIVNDYGGRSRINVPLQP